MHLTDKEITQLYKDDTRESFYKILDTRTKESICINLTESDYRNYSTPPYKRDTWTSDYLYSKFGHEQKNSSFKEDYSNRY